MNKILNLKLFKKPLFKKGKRNVQQTAENSKHFLNRLMLMDKPFRGVQEEV